MGTLNYPLSPFSYLFCVAAAAAWAAALPLVCQVDLFPVETDVADVVKAVVDDVALSHLPPSPRLEQLLRERRGVDVCFADASFEASQRLSRL